MSPLRNTSTAECSQPAGGQAEARRTSPSQITRRSFLKGVSGTAGASPLIGVGSAGAAEQQPGPTLAPGNDQTLRGSDLNYSTGLKREGLPGDPFIQSNSSSGSTSEGTPYPATSTLDNFRNRPGSQTGNARIGAQFELTGDQASTAIITLQGTLPGNHSNISIYTEDTNYEWDGWPELPPPEPFTSGTVSLELYAVVLDITDHGWNAERDEIRRVGPVYQKTIGGTNESHQLPPGDQPVSTEFSMSFAAGRRYAITLELKSTVTVGGYDMDEHYAMVSGNLYAHLNSISLDWSGGPAETTSDADQETVLPDWLEYLPYAGPLVLLPPAVWYLRKRFRPTPTTPPTDPGLPADPIDDQTDYVDAPCFRNE